METSIEISLYPLREAYKEQITAFIHRLRRHQGIQLITNGMSTQVFGEYDVVMQALNQEMKSELGTHRSMFVLKIGAGIMTPDQLPPDLQS